MEELAIFEEAVAGAQHTKKNVREFNGASNFNKDDDEVYDTNDIFPPSRDRSNKL
jgi:hypothetical protein